MIKRVITFTNPAYLSLRLRQMVVKQPSLKSSSESNESDDYALTTTIPIEDIGVVVLDNKQVTITSALMASLLEENIAIITCNDQHLPVGLQLPLDGNHLQSERFREQINASEPLKKQLWQQTVQQKIRNQAELLDWRGIECRNMRKWVGEVRSGDADNLEGRAAAYYWKVVFPEHPDFVRGREEEAPNNLLNYGYAIVRAMMARALVAAGLLPTFGIHHHNRYNAYCLADDIMEPYRPFVDKLVIDIIHWKTQYTIITNEHKRALLSLPVTDVMIDGHRSPMMIAIQTTANSVQRCFSGESRKIIYPEWI